MKQKLSALIVDDERLARKELSTMLADYKNISICGEAEDVPSALKAIKDASPDIIFLDIQMPGKSGFDLLKEIPTTAKIIFVTAFDEYALRAFEVNALDYLLKPIAPERLQKAIERIQMEQDQEAQPEKKLHYEDRLFINFDSHLQFLKISSILSIIAAGDYTQVMLNNSTNGLTLKSMKEWENRLPENYFCRIHRSTIINMEHIERLEEWFNYSYRVYIKGVKEPFLLSRRYVTKLKSKLG